MGGPSGSNQGTQTAAGGWQPPTNPTPQAPVGNVGGNALIDWIFGGNFGTPSIPNPYTAANFLGFGAQNNYSTQNPPPKMPPVAVPKQPAPQQTGTGGAPAWAASQGGTSPTWGAQLPNQVQSAPATAIGQMTPSLPNPDIGTFGTGGNAPATPPQGLFGLHGQPGINGLRPGPWNDPRFVKAFGPKNVSSSNPGAVGGPK